MGRNLLDDRTADRLLAGAVLPEDAPPGYAEVATLMRALAGPPAPAELARQGETVAAMMTAVISSPAPPLVPSREHAGLSRLLRPRIAATLLAGVLLTSGVAMAETRVLPSSAQHAMHQAFGWMGIPDSKGHGESAATAQPVQSHRGGNRPGASIGHESNARSNRTMGHGHHRPTAAGPKEEKTNRMCRALLHGRGGERGKKLSARAFARVRTAAAAHGFDSARAYCASVAANARPGKDKAKAPDKRSKKPSKHHHHHKAGDGKDHDTASRHRVSNVRKEGSHGGSRS